MTDCYEATIEDRHTTGTALAAAEVRAQALRDAAARLRIMGDMGGMQVVMDMIDQPAPAQRAPRSEELPCEDCGGITFLWWAPHQLWNYVVGGPEARDDPGAMLCPNCFIRRAEAAGFNSSVWMVSPQTPDPAQSAAEANEGRDMLLAVTAYKQGQAAHEAGFIARDPRVILSEALRALSNTKGGE